MQDSDFPAALERSRGLGKHAVACLQGTHKRAESSLGESELFQREQRRLPGLWMKYGLDVSSRLEEDLDGSLRGDAVLGAAIRVAHVGVKDPDLK